MANISLARARWPQAFFDGAEDEIGNDSQQRRGNGAGENQAVVHGGHAAKDQLAQSAGTDGGGDSCDTDAGDGGDPKSGEDNARGEGKLNLKQQLAVSESHA